MLNFDFETSIKLNALADLLQKALSLIIHIGVKVKSEILYFVHPMHTHLASIESVRCRLLKIRNALQAIGHSSVVL